MLIAESMAQQLLAGGWTRESMAAAGYVVSEAAIRIGETAAMAASRVSGVQPGDPAPSYNGGASLLPVSFNGGGSLLPDAFDIIQLGAVAPEPPGMPDVSAIGLPFLIALIAKGGVLALGVLKAFIATFGWKTIAGILGTVLAARVLSMLNDPDDTQVELAEAAGVGRIVKRWTANGRDFWMTEDGRMYVRLKSGVIKSWRPRKPLVLVPGGRLNIKSAVRAQRFLDRQWRTIAKRVKQLKLA